LPNQRAVRTIKQSIVSFGTSGIIREVKERKLFTGLNLPQTKASFSVSFSARRQARKKQERPWKRGTQGRLGRHCQEGLKPSQQRRIANFRSGVGRLSVHEQ